jgi:(2Fe-2S) ferredoxin
MSLNQTARTAIVATFVSALESAENTGSLVTQVCDMAAKHLKGEEIEKDDLESLVTDISKARGWKEKALKARSSEVRIVLKSYIELPEAVVAYKAKAKRCDWHTMLKLARRLVAGDSIKTAVAACLETSVGSPSSKVKPSGRVAGALAAWYKDATPDKQKAIVKAAALLGIKLTIKDQE